VDCSVSAAEVAEPVLSFPLRHGAFVVVPFVAAS
jgi:hypothetical protein